MTKFEKTRTELRRLFTKLVPQAREKGYDISLREDINTKGERNLELSGSFKDEKGNWHSPFFQFFWEKYPNSIDKNMADLKAAIKKEGFKL